MKCPYCTSLDTKVIDSRLTDANDSVRRRRECERCSKRFTTYERIETKPIAVIKKDNTREPFDRNKILSGLIRACIKRDINVESLKELVDDIENEIHNMPGNEINSRELGNLVLKRLKGLDKVAYIRFASVYKQFDSIKQFTNELTRLKKNK
ncbi:MAG TPA: transcriptional regulator NrdR [Actinobacteria bacterium]|nr:transcriptional regulator NrdR [Actinomycetota bacterium]